MYTRKIIEAQLKFGQLDTDKVYIVGDEFALH